MGKKSKKIAAAVEITRGQPPLGGRGAGETPMLTFRVLADQRKKWRRAARKAGKSLSEWIRMVADAAS